MWAVLKKSIEIKGEFIETEMNNEWNYFCPIIVGTFLYTFLKLNVTSIMRQRQQYASCVEKVLRLKSYLSRQKWTMNETIFVP